MNSNFKSEIEFLKKVYVQIPKLTYKIFFSILIGIFPGAIFYNLIIWLEEKEIDWLSWIFIILLLGILMYLNGLYHNSGGAKGLKTFLEKLGVIIPIAVIFNLIFIYTGVFALIVMLIPHENLFLNVPHPDLEQVADFFLWNFFEMIPLLDFTETVSWKVPLEYQNSSQESPGASLVGWILIVFKLAIVIPLVNFIKEYFIGK